MDTPARPLLIGIGNEFGRDDAVGLMVVRELRTRLPEHVEILEQSGEASALMAAWEGAETVILIDAVQSGAAPGTIHRHDASRQPLPAKWFRCSTHQLGVAEAVELARTLNFLPARVIVFGIEGKDFSPGQGLSVEVTASVQKAAAQVLEELAETSGKRTGGE